ncbi:hypothetical protein FACS1894178_5880 [Bacteroidia bacterium]|nr:hypothetical protein FACS1894178_5880 [Bacteroidia bacterium]
MNIIPENYIQLIIVLAFSLIIGLSQRKMQLKMQDKEHEPFFGADRTFALIGVLGYILFIISPETKIFWGAGAIGMFILLGINYTYKLRHLKKYGLTSIVTALITYCIPALVITQPLELSLMVLVIVLLLTEMKESFISLTSKMNNDEFFTLAKFIIIAGVIMPILPNTRIWEDINLTPRNICLSTVIISGMSYASYILRKFVFKNKGMLITGILGGLYSSTATSIVLSRKSKKSPDYLANRYSGTIILAFAMMFIRIAILLFIFNPKLFQQSWYYFLIMAVFTSLTGIFVYMYKKPTEEQLKEIGDLDDDKNPLELKIALLFAALFVVFTIITHYTLLYFGENGLSVLSIFVGITDITPFLTNLFQENMLHPSLIILASFIAMMSNNVVKTVYSVTLASKAGRKTMLIAMTVISLLNASLLLLILF